jgi:taurine dioxygenase
MQVYEKFHVSNLDKNSAAPFGRLLYHHEYMWVEDGCRVASLYGKEVEQPSVPTIFVSAKQAWETLPADLRAQVDGRFALHCQDATDRRRDNTSDVLTVTFPVKHFARLPIGYRHPRIDQTVLYVCPLATHHIEGMDYDACETLLEKLFDHLYARENVLEHYWRQGDLVVWDNYTVQHGRPNLQFEGAARVLRKTMTPHPGGEQEHASRPVFATLGT